MDATDPIELRLALAYAGFSLDVDLVLPGRGVSALFGVSGSGKTTLLRIAAGLEKGATGRVAVAGEVWQDSAQNVFVPTHRRPLGMVFQDAALFPHLSVRANLGFGQSRSAGNGGGNNGSGNGAGDVARAPVVELLGIGHLLDRQPGTLSGGEQQRVAIARALLARPRLLLMDEPLAALDERRKAEFLPWLEKLHDELEIPVLYVSHALTEVARLADHLVQLEDGRALASGPLAEVLPRLDLPLSQGEEAFVMIAATVGAYDTRYALARLDFEGQSLWAPSRPRPLGTRVRIRVQARDVSLALSPQVDSSILNDLAGHIESLDDQPPGRLLVRLRVGNANILARLTRKSADRLGIAAGMPIRVQIKSVALHD